MSHRIILITMMVFFVFPLHTTYAGNTHGDHDEQIVIALSLDDFELAETDISDMEVGDAQTFTTDSGKRIDVLRTEHGAEIYVDGTLIEAGTFGDDELHLGHKVVNAHVEVICETEDECERTVLISEDEDIELDALHDEEHHVEHHEKIIVITRESETN